LKIYYGINALKKAGLKKPVVTIGTFDGVHLGHQRLLNKTVREAKKLKTKSLVITFDPHPQSIVRQGIRPLSLISLAHRLELFRDMKIDCVLVINFKKSFSRLEPNEFVEKILSKEINAKEVVLAQNFRFGSSRKGTVKLIKQLSHKFDIKVHEIPLAKISGKVISSTEVRNLIKRGKLKMAQARLGRRVTVLGTVKKGDSLARKLGFPTANIDPHHEVVPPAGVYAAYALVKNRVFKGVVNIGFRPTITAESGIEPESRVKLHLIGFKGNLYNSLILIEFVQKIRPEKRFKDLDHLRDNIYKDINKTKNILLYN